MPGGAGPAWPAGGGVARRRASFGMGPALGGASFGTLGELRRVAAGSRHESDRESVFAPKGAAPNSGDRRESAGPSFGALSQSRRVSCSDLDINRTESQFSRRKGRRRRENSGRPLTPTTKDGTQPAH